MKAHLSAYEIAQALKVDRATVTRWISKGLIKGAMKPKGSQAWQVPITSYSEFVKAKHESR